MRNEAKRNVLETDSAIPTSEPNQITSPGMPVQNFFHNQTSDFYPSNTVEFLMNNIYTKRKEIRRKHQELEEAQNELQKNYYLLSSHFNMYSPSYIGNSDSFDSDSDCLYDRSFKKRKIEEVSPLLEKRQGSYCP